MVPDEDIVRKLVELLDQADLTTTTTSAIRRQLEQELGIDLSDRKAFVREQVDLYLQNHHQNQDQDGVPAEDVHGQPGEMNEDDAGEDGEEEEQDEGEEEVEDEDEEEEEEHAKPELDSRRLQAKINRAKKESLQKEKKKRSGGGGFSKLCKLSPELQALTGEEELSRTQVVKFLWGYIREKNLQDPSNKRKIICDDALRTVFATDTTDMFKMNKLLSKHIWPIDSITDSKPKKTNKREDSDNEEDEPKPKKQKSEGGKGRGTGFTTPLPLSQPLMQFLGTGESQLPRSEVVKRLWAYIKENALQDPSDKRQILCDSKLQELFGCDKFTGFVMTKHLAPHFLKS